MTKEGEEAEYIEQRGRSMQFWPTISFDAASSASGSDHACHFGGCLVGLAAAQVITGWDKVVTTVGTRDTALVVTLAYMAWRVADFF